MENDYIFMDLSTDSGEGLTAYEENGKYYMRIQDNKKEISEHLFRAIQEEFTMDELPFSEKLEKLSTSIGSVKLGDDSEKICREVRGKE